MVVLVNSTKQSEEATNIYVSQTLIEEIMPKTKLQKSKNLQLSNKYFLVG